ncbi:MAG: amidohydrolase family protein, partial [Chlorobi bacterium]|nr:amidohydrolase family protein [Chlorobiota bacterium]
MKSLIKKVCTVGFVLILLGSFIQSGLIAQIQTTVMPKTGFEERIEKAVNDIRIIDTHEHLRTEEGVMKDSLYDFIYLFQQYINYDLISAGMPKSVFLKVNDTSYSLKERWEMFKPYWEVTRTTAYGRVPLIVANDLYGIPDINDNTYRKLSEAINDSMQWGWYKHVLKDKAKIDISILDRRHKRFGKDLFRHVERFDDFIYVFTFPEIKKLGEKYGIEVKSLDDFVSALDSAFQAGLDYEMVGVKSGLAYNRTIKYDKVTKEKAEDVFYRVTSRDTSQTPLDFESVKPLQDYMMHRLLDLVDRYDLPFQIHTGLQTGSGNNILNSKPTLLNNLFHEYPGVKFCLFHGSYPYGGELSVLAKNFPNVYIDMCWLYVISPSYSERYLHEWIETVPANKIMAFGGDYITVEDIYA